MSDSPIARLCRRFGIAERYHDIWGNEHRTPEATARTLLAAMGIDAADEARAASALEAVEARDWRRGLPPVCVVIEDAAHAELRVTLPASARGSPLRWRLTLEDGAVEEHESAPVADRAQARRTLDGEEWLAARCEVPVPPMLGYHRLALEVSREGAEPWRAETTLVVAPARCYRPAALEGEGRVWGPAAQLYALRSARNWGIGDFTDLLRVVEFAADAGAGIVGVSPLHALFPHDPAHASPYSPSSRLFLNPLHLDVEAIAEFAECTAMRDVVAGEGFQARLRALRASEQVDYERVAAAKARVLDGLYRHFRDNHLRAGDARAEAFDAFRQREGEALRRHALFEALQAHLHAEDAAVWGWPAWPARYRDPAGEAVTAFERTHAEAIEAREYLQWQARLQLERIGRRASELGLGVGLYQDLAVGVDAGGAETWSNREGFALDARVGAPPDDFNRAGQDWGLPPWRPERLRETAYAAFVRTLRASMRTAGALRIDHVMGLARQFWIPTGASAAEGTYVRYPFDDLLALLALESQRNQCLIVGEDLGTVPDDVREGLARFGVLSYRLLYFGKDADGAFLAPDAYPRQAMVCVTTHDLPTLAGYWSGTDIELRRELGLVPEPERHEAQVVGRAEDRARLLLALGHEGLLPGDDDAVLSSFPEMTPPLSAAIHRFLARSPAHVLAVQLEDLLGQREQVNLPGTTDAYPNWRIKLALDIEAWADDPRVGALLAALREERGSAVLPPEPPAARPPPEPVIPRATYRLQLDAGTGFDRAAELVPYLAALGVSHIYCSPYLQARAGSTHGYDIRDHGALSAELGGEDGFRRFAAALHRNGMSQVMDVVPNHMGVMGSDNGWWLDVLENGPASRYAEHFDIDWSPLKDELRGKVLVPVLGDHYGNVLEAGELRLELDERAGSLSVHYHEHRFPLDPRTYPMVLGRRIDRLEQRLDTEHATVLEFQSLLTAFANLPSREHVEPDEVAERARDESIHKARLASLREADADVRAHVDECLREVNGTPDYPADRGLMHEILEAQAYRLAYWRVASHDINYRRFFDINDLAALRMEREEVFEATHGLVLELVSRGEVTGLRIDHPDGLYDPAAYFRRVQARVAALAGAVDPDPDHESIYVVAEKILSPGESLPGDWPIHGTTGYEFSALAGGLFVDPRGAERLTRAYETFIGAPASLASIAHDARRLVVEEALSAELNVLSRELSRIAESDPHTRDMTEPTLHEALAEVAACFPVYRTYVSETGTSPDDESHVDRAVAEARRRARSVEATVFDFVREALLARVAGGRAEPERARARRFAMRFQQLTAPVMAKGVEDTAFYRYHRLVSLNEVGDDPGRLGTSIEAFHRALAERARRMPRGMLCTSTHDSKRSEDARMRLHALSELTREWSQRVTAWAAMNRPRRTVVDGVGVPEPATEYALYQALLGVWPLEGGIEAGAGLGERLRRYAIKAAREAKLHTAWTNPDPDYEAALEAFVDAIVDPRESAAFLEDFVAFQRRAARIGLLSSLALTLLKLAAPGVPDVYQGNEIWRFDLVDPDNRRGVDFDALARQLSDLDTECERVGAAELAADLAGAPEDGRIKLWVIRRALALRRADPELFERGEYVPVEVRGNASDRVVSFARRAGARLAVCVVPRLLAGTLGEEARAPVRDAGWDTTRIRLPGPPPAALRDCFTGARYPIDPACAELPVTEILDPFPVALLVADDEARPR